MPLDPLTLLMLLAIGLLAGVASGFVGVGGGLVLVPAMVVFWASASTPPKAPVLP